MQRTKKGFTLIELMVVVLIIAILGALGLVAYGNANTSARDGKRKADIEAVRQALLLYKQENSGYPTGSFATIAQAMVNAGYLSAPAPAEQKTGHAAYSRSDTTSTTSFCICATMENNKGNQTNSTCSGTWSTNSGGYYCAKP